MQRAVRLARFWNWLPAFRAVAETEHLPTASAELHVTPSALSRTIRLLEEDLGAALFERVGKSLVLNDRGRAFLAAVRAAMRVVDDGVDALESGAPRGPVYLSCATPVAPIYVLPALVALRRRHPGIVAHVSSRNAGDVNGRLRRGELDIALHDEPTPDDQLTIEPLAPMRHHVYAGPAHPLARRRKIPDAELLEHSFAAPPPAADGTPTDPWPRHRRRTVGLVVTHMQPALDACARGDVLAVLPDPIARRHRLRRLPVELDATTTMCLVYRPALPLRGRIDLVLDALRDAARRARR